MVKTLHARASASEKDFEEYEGESEPNMKFSHALVVVLVLHILAVGGVFAFNTLKGRHPAQDRTKPAVAGKVVSASKPDVIAAPANKKTAPAREAAPSVANKSPEKTQAEAGAATHAVAAGDTLTRIAAANKTTVEAIEKANGLASNSSIRVGQVLKIPEKSNPAPAKLETSVPKTSEAKPAAPAVKSADAKPAPAAKTSEAKPAAPAVKSADAKPAPAAKTPDTKPAAPAAKSADAKPAPVVKAAETKPVGDQPPKADTKPAASDKAYTVAKGDNPYSIAKKMKVSYNALIKANNIQDPTKLQIGQKLIIP